MSNHRRIARLLPVLATLAALTGCGVENQVAPNAADPRPMPYGSEDWAFADPDDAAETVVPLTVDPAANVVHDPPTVAEEEPPAAEEEAPPAAEEEPPAAEEEAPPAAEEEPPAAEEEPPAAEEEPPAAEEEPPAAEEEPPPVVEEPPAAEEEPPPVVEEPPAAEEEPPAAEEEPPPVVEEEPPAPAYSWQGYSLYVEPDSNAADQVEAWLNVDPLGTARMEVMADQPLGLWFGDWSGDIAAAVDSALDEAGDQLLVMVAYDIPNRDCGAWSAGGAADANEYDAWIAGFAEGLQGRDAIVVLEPDALALVTCLDDAGKADRLSMMSDAVDTLTAAGASVYLDAGDSNWIPSQDMAEQLLGAGVTRAAGFALNVSHTEYTDNEIAFAEEIRAIVGADAHYVIDTGRNGLGPTWDNEWCNPQGVAVGELPTLDSGVDGLDAFLWIKPPGESDGSCNGGPVAGAWWPEYASEMMAAAGY
jgi:endoglucanase